jgi:hypothetical protein
VRLSTAVAPTVRLTVLGLGASDDRPATADQAVLSGRSRAIDP